MEVALEGLLPDMLGNIEFQIRSFQGKSDLLRKLPGRLKGYSYCLPDDEAILVLVDRDNDDCIALKQRLEKISGEANLTSKTQGGKRFRVVNRIVIEELESWFFGDWDAVRKAYPRVPENIPRRSKYRNPDAISGTWEALEKIMKKARYFSTGLRKVECAREISKYLSPTTNRSTSFNIFAQAIDDVLAWD